MPKKEREKKEKRGVWCYYKIEGDKLARINRKCPRCDSFMAFHRKPQPRWYCGKCHYTEWVRERSR
ncbi:30S ribosomal protein S27ae [archaeon]|nr:30S ribosomal protein S27ae [archaeon]